MDYSTSSMGHYYYGEEFAYKLHKSDFATPCIDVIIDT